MSISLSGCIILIECILLKAGSERKLSTLFILYNVQYLIDVLNTICYTQSNAFTVVVAAIIVVIVYLCVYISSCRESTVV